MSGRLIEVLFTVFQTDNNHGALITDRLVGVLFTVFYRQQSRDFDN